MFSGDDSVLNRVLISFLVVAAFMLISGLAIGVVASGANGGLFDNGGSTGADVSGDNHQNPSELGGSGDLSTVERQLANRISRQIESGAINLSQGQYDDVQDSLSGSQYEQLLDDYSEVSSETGTENQSQLFRELRRQQQSYAIAAQSYSQLYAIYNGSANYTTPTNRRLLTSLSIVSNDTTLNGTNTTGETATDIEFNTTQRRQLARELDLRWQAVNENATQVLEAYTELEQVRSRNYSEAISSVRTSRQNIRRTQQAVRQDQLTNVSIAATAVKPTGSFTDPIRIQGQLTTANGTAVGSQQIQLRIANQTRETKTNATGWFEIAYRPTTVALNATNASITFVPESSSSYTYATTNVSVSVSQAEPDILLQTQPSEVRFNDTVTVSGRVSVDDVGAGGVPYLVTLDGQFIAQDTTASNGTLENDFSLPGSVGTGDREVRVSLLVSDQALASANTSTPITVPEQQSNLTLSVDSVEGRSVQVSGRVSISEFGVEGQRVQLTTANTTLGTVTTGTNGQFQTTVVIPSDQLDSGLFDDSTTLSLQAVYGTERSNVESAQASATVSITHPSWLLIVGAVVIGSGVFLVGGYLIYSRLRETDSSPKEGTKTWQSMAEASETEPLAQARDALASDQPEVAVQYGYAAIRMQLENQTGIGTAKTPWEFYRTYHENKTETDTVRTLQQATELYERAVFASETVSTTTAEEFLAQLDRIAESAAPDKK